MSKRLSLFLVWLPMLIFKPQYVESRTSLEHGTCRNLSLNETFLAACMHSAELTSPWIKSNNNESRCPLPTLPDYRDQDKNRGLHPYQRNSKNSVAVKSISSILLVNVDDLKTVNQNKLEFCEKRDPGKKSLEKTSETDGSILDAKKEEISKGRAANNGCKNSGLTNFESPTHVFVEELNSDAPVILNSPAESNGKSLTLSEETIQSNVFIGPLNDPALNQGDGEITHEGGESQTSYDEPLDEKSKKKAIYLSGSVNRHQLHEDDTYRRLQSSFRSSGTYPLKTQKTENHNTEPNEDETYGHLQSSLRSTSSSHPVKTEVSDDNNYNIELSADEIPRRPQSSLRGSGYTEPNEDETYRHLQSSLRGSSPYPTKTKVNYNYNTEPNEDETYRHLQSSLRGSGSYPTKIKVNDDGFYSTKTKVTNDDSYTTKSKVNDDKFYTTTTKVNDDDLYPTKSKVTNDDSYTTKTKVNDDGFYSTTTKLNEGGFYTTKTKVTNDDSYTTKTKVSDDGFYSTTTKVNDGVYYPTKTKVNKIDSYPTKTKANDDDAEKNEVDDDEDVESPKPTIVRGDDTEHGNRTSVDDDDDEEEEPWQRDLHQLPSHESITGGEEISIKKMPFLALLKMDLGSGTSYCTSSIISPVWVLTAAHCVVRIRSARDVEVFAGQSGFASARQGDKGQRRKGAAVHIHPSFKHSESPGNGDIALIKVNMPFILDKIHVSKIKLRGKSWFEDVRNDNCVSAGWGRQKFYAQNTGPLQSFQSVALHGEDSCPCVPQDQKDTIVCLERSQGKGICKGDSGGPLICNGELVGVAHVLFPTPFLCWQVFTSEPECGDNNWIDIYMYTCPYLDWIKSYVGEKVPPRPSTCSAGRPMYQALFIAATALTLPLLMKLILFSHV